MASLNELSKEIHKNAKAHGWWNEHRPFGEIIALIHSELSEALEEYRAGKPIVYFNCGGHCEPMTCNFEHRCQCFAKYASEGVAEHCKPEGIAIELADTIIRILDYCGYAKIDIEEAIQLKNEYNKTREYKHGGKII